MRDRQPERVLEERGHREPVRDRAHHRRLGAGVHEAEETVLVAGHEVDHGREQQQPDGDRAHPPQAGAAERVGGGIAGDQGCGDGLSVIGADSRGRRDLGESRPCLAPS